MYSKFTDIRRLIKNRGDRIVSRMCGVYKITCLPNGMFYIGSSIDIYKRWDNHRWQLKHNKHTNNYLQNAWNKYGEDNFVFEILELCENKDQFNLEQEYLNKYKPFARLNSGFNLLENAGNQYDKSKIEFIDFDEIGVPHKIKERNCSVFMPITIDDYIGKTKKELQDEYDGYVMMLDLYEDMATCDPDYE